VNNNLLIQLKRDQQIVVAIDEEMQTTMDLHVGGVAYTTKSLAAVIQQRIDAANELFDARVRLHGAVKKYAAIDKRVKPFVAELRLLVLALFGEKSPRVLSFGFAPNKKRRKLSVQEKVAAAAKARATRMARGTMGPRQRALLASTVAR
jgi:hypothetical protein